VSAAAGSDELLALARGLLTPTALAELAVLAGCLGLAWALVRLLRGSARPASSIWFGQAIVDGVLFPLLALLLALLARRLLEAWVPIAVFRVALPALMALAAIRVTVRVLRHTYAESALMGVVERSVSWLAWLATLAWVTGVAPLLLAEMDELRWTMGGTRVSLRDLLDGAVTAVVVLLASLWISAAIEDRLLRGSGSLSLRKMLAKLVRAALLFVGLMIALGAAGIDLTALGVLGGALGVGIGLGLQKLAANYVSGFVILAENSLRIGDLVTVDGFEGHITDINTRYTVIRAPSGRESIVPNEMMITQRVENASLSDRRIVVQTAVQVAYGTDLEPLMAELAQAVAQVPRVLTDPAVAVRLQNFGADGLDLAIAFWIGDPENGVANVRSDVNLAILRLLTARGIEIPFPQRVVHSG